MHKVRNILSFRKSEQFLSLTLGLALLAQSVAIPTPAHAVTIEGSPQAESCATSTLSILSDGTEIGSISESESTFPAQIVHHSTWPGLVSLLWGSSEWIWQSPSETQPSIDQTITFSKNYIITETPISATLTLFADDFYTARINGTTIGEDHGQNPEHLNYINESIHSVDPNLLHTGENTLEIIVTNTGALNTSTFDENPAGTAFRLEVVTRHCVPVIDPPATEQFVHVFKYIGGTLANQSSTHNTAFLTSHTWYSNTTGTGTAQVSLATTSGETSVLGYTYQSPAISSPYDYSVREVFDSEDPTGTVSATDGCHAGQFRLKGYRVGTTLQEAEEAIATTTAPSLFSLTNDLYVIIENNQCVVGGESISSPVPPASGGGGTGTNYVYGCTDPTSSNFNPLATSDDHTCQNSLKASEPAIATSTATTTIPTVVQQLPQEGEVLGVTASSSQNEITACGMYLDAYLRAGSKNKTEVKKLQSFLNTQGSIQLPVNGRFGPLTTKAVNDFQVKYGIEVLQPWVDAGLYKDTKKGTGYVYKTTKRWINKLNCTQLDLPTPQLP